MNSHNDLDPQAIAQVRELTNVDEARAARLLRVSDPGSAVTSPGPTSGADSSVEV